MHKQKRKSVGLTLEEAAKAADISPSSLALYEKEKLPIPLSAFIKLSRIYDFDIFDIYNVHDPYFIEIDVNPYYAIKAHCRYRIIKERDIHIKFGNTLPDKYYKDLFIGYIKETIKDSTLLLNYHEIKQIADEDAEPDLEL